MKMATEESDESDHKQLRGCSEGGKFESWQKEILGLLFVRVSWFEGNKDLVYWLVSTLARIAVMLFLRKKSLPPKKRKKARRKGNAKK